MIDDRFKYWHSIFGEHFYELIPGAQDEGPNLLNGDMSPVQQDAYERLRGRATRARDSMAYDHSP